MSGVSARELNRQLLERIEQTSGGGGGVGGSSTHISDDRPTNTKSGDIWFQTGFGEFGTVGTELTVIVSNAIISEEEPPDELLDTNTKLWYDIEE